jgi:hypothetical protein
MQQREPKTLEWPRGSGRVAVYSSEEQELMLRLADDALRYPKGHPIREERNRECLFLHDLKVEFGLDLVADDRLTKEEP